MSTPVLDVVVPVHNEQHTLAACVERLNGHLSHTFPYPYRITIADNASTDETWQVACGLSRAYPAVEAVRLEEKGRGRALKQVWLASDAPILAYMDVDLSTDLDALWPLVAPLMSGHSDVAIGTRLHRGARVVRGPKRELVSRCYNLLLRGTLGAGFSDAQCGFKAIRKDVADELLPLVEDPTWFFDTELLVLAERSGLRVHEVPVDWFDDPDSRVDIVSTAVDDLRGVVRLRRALSAGSLPVADVAARIGRGRSHRGLGGQLLRFAGVGVLSTVLHLGLFTLLRTGMGSGQAANLVALLAATRRQHGAEPAVDLRRARAGAGGAPAPRRPGRLRPHPGDDLGRPGAAAPLGRRGADLAGDGSARARHGLLDAGAVRRHAPVDLPVRGCALRLGAALTREG